MCYINLDLPNSLTLGTYRVVKGRLVYTHFRSDFDLEDVIFGRCDSAVAEGVALKVGFLILSFTLFCLLHVRFCVH